MELRLLTVICVSIYPTHLCRFYSDPASKYPRRPTQKMALRSVVSNYALPLLPPLSALVDASEHVLRRRVKRRLSVSMVKRSWEYLFAALLDPELNAVGGAPDPDDITISKRAWDLALQEWRLSLRALAGAAWC